MSMQMLVNTCNPAVVARSCSSTPGAGQCSVSAPVSSSSSCVLRAREVVGRLWAACEAASWLCTITKKLGRPELMRGCSKRPAPGGKPSDEPSRG